jgi:hypothetical protein
MIFIHLIGAVFFYLLNGKFVYFGDTSIIAKPPLNTAGLAPNIYPVFALVGYREPVI